ncbi:MAG: hypothetical protein ACJASI_002685 [Glaciecola sp.]|jgi:hypothetical protein
MKKTLIAIATLSSLLVVPTASAEVTAYGRVIYNIVSDDTSDDLYFGRHEFAESTIGIKGYYDYEGLTIGAQVEIGLDEGVSNLLQNDSNARNRIQEIWVAGKFGKLKVGTGAAITWVVSDVDQSGTWWSDPLGMSQRFGSTRRGPGAQSQTPFVQTQSIFNERISYESPSFLDGAKFYAQLNEDSGYEFAIKYLANGWRVNAWTVDYGDADNDADPQANIDGNGSLGFFGSESGRGVLAGYKHSSGVNFTGTYGQADQLNGSERDFLNWKLGYTQGKHAVSVSMGNYNSEDASGVSGPEHNRTTLAYHFVPVGGVRVWVQATEGDTEGQNSFNAFALGGMVKF